MKKLATTVSILLLVGALAVPVLANRGDWGEWSRGYGYCGQGGGSYGNLPQNQSDELSRLEQKFYEDTAKLREAIWTKSREVNTLLNSSDPDPKKIRSLQNEISELRTKLDQESVNFKLEARKVSPNISYYSHGYHGGYGSHMRGHYGPHGYGHHHW